MRLFRAPLKISEGSGGDGPAIGCTVDSPLIEVGSVLENRRWCPLAGRRAGRCSGGNRRKTPPVPTCFVLGYLRRAWTRSATIVCTKLLTGDAAHGRKSARLAGAPRPGLRCVVKIEQGAAGDEAVQVVTSVGREKGHGAALCRCGRHQFASPSQRRLRTLVSNFVHTPSDNERILPDRTTT
jgi:hypothetical protein